MYVLYTQIHLLSTFESNIPEDKRPLPAIRTKQIVVTPTMPAHPADAFFIRAGEADLFDPYFHKLPDNDLKH